MDKRSPSGSRASSSGAEEAERVRLTRQVGSRLRTLRDERSRLEGRVISQGEVGAAIGGIDAPRMNTYERGKKLPGAPVLVKLARYYGVTLDHLITGGGEPPKVIVRPATVKPRADRKFDPLFEKIRALPPKALRLVRATIDYLARHGSEAPSAASLTRKRMKKPTRR